MTKVWMLAGVLMATGADAEEAPEESARARNVVALDVGGLLQNSVGVSAERAMAERMSVRLGLRVGLSALWIQRPLAFTNTGEQFESINTRDTSIALEPGARFFLTGAAPEGLWVGPQLGLRLGWIDSTFERPGGPGASSSQSSRSLNVSASALAGYSAILGKGLTLQAAAGLDLNYGRPLGAREGVGYFFSDVTQWALRPLTQLSLGYAF